MDDRYTAGRLFQQFSTFQDACDAKALEIIRADAEDACAVATANQQTRRPGATGRVPEIAGKRATRYST